MPMEKPPILRLASPVRPTSPRTSSARASGGPPARAAMRRWVRARRAGWKLVASSTAPTVEGGLSRSWYLRPATVAVPALGCTRPSSMRSVVVLPDPLGPRKPVTRPGSTVNDRSSTARTGPKCLESPRISIGNPRVVAPTVIGGDPSASDRDDSVSRRCDLAGGTSRSGRCAPLDELIGQQQPDRHGQLVIDARHGGPAVDPADEGRGPDVADHAGPAGEGGH